MQIIFRTYIKNEERFNLLKRTIGSAFDKGIDTLGKMTILDDVSPAEWANRIKEWAESIGVAYKYADGPCDTKNGFVESLRLANPDEIILCCVDDIVFGKGSLDAFKNILNKDIPALEERGIPWGMVGSFACYDPHPQFANTSLWHYPLQLFYATVCHFISPAMQRGMIERWDAILAGKLPMPQMCDDIFAKLYMIDSGLLLFNTIGDYVQHTGVGQRSFDDDPKAGSSYYTSNHFVGE